MIPPALKDQINKLKAQGKPNETVKLELIKSGWSKNQINEAMDLIDLSEKYSSSPKQPIQPDPASSKKMDSPAKADISPQPQNQKMHVVPAGEQKPTVSQESSQGKIKKTVTDYFVGLLTGDKKFKVILVGLLLGLIACIQPSIYLFKNVLPFLDDIENRVQLVIDEVFPEELEITLQEGVATTNVNEPYYLTISQSTLNNFIKKEEDEASPQSKIRVLTIDTNARIEDFEKHQSIALLTSQNLVYYSDEGIQIQPLAGTPDMVVNKKFIEDKIDEFNKGGKIVNFVKSAIYVSPILIAILLWMIFIVDVLFGAFILWIINKILLTSLKFSKLFVLTGALYSLSTIFMTIIRAFSSLTVFELWFNTALDVVMLSAGYVIISKYKKEFIRA